MKIALKFRIALIITAVSLFLTFLAGVSAEVRWLTLAKRLLGATVLFGVIGYFAGLLIENYFRSYALKQGEQQPGPDESQEPDAATFNAFTAESFERISKE